MTTNDTAPAAEALRDPATEKKFAVAQVAAPLLTAAAMPFLDPQAAETVTTFLAAPALIAAVNAAGLISEQTLHQIPGGDILRAHRVPFLVSATTTLTAATTAALQGAPGIDSLVAGILTTPSMAFLVSAAWWAANGYVAFALRQVIGNRRQRRAATQAAAEQPAPDGNLTSAQREILERWYAYISGERGAHPSQELNLYAHGPTAWEGIIEAAPGRPVTVTAETVSGVYRVPAAWVSITPGPHNSSKSILVRTVELPPEEQQFGELEGQWMQRVARPGKCMPGTHLEGTVQDPATGGVAAWIVADEDTDAITMPDRYQLAGALRSTMLLVSVEATQDPRKAILRKMDRSPLEDGRPLPGADVLKANKNGYIQIGTGVSGKPSRLQIFDPAVGSQHVLVAGVTGSGKGGVLQLIALGYHVNHVAIIYADPKGSSNPDIKTMAAYAGCGKDAAMGALRVAYAILEHRIAESAETDAKNFKPTATRPFIGVILDEFAQLLGDKAPHKKEAGYIIAAFAEQGRSMGVGLVLCGQIMNLEKMGGDTSIRDNVFYGGALVLLRSDSAQKDRVDLPESFAGVDPSKIPAFWKSGNESLIYDAAIPEDDPTRTFGVGYTVGPDERAEMMRAWILESAAGLFDPKQIVHPADFPNWHERDLIATVPVGPAAEDSEDGPAWTPGPVTSFTKEPTAEEKILTVLDERREPMGLEVGYLHKDQITTMTGVAAKTVENTLSRLTKAGKLVRREAGSGEYGLPLLATAGDGED